MVYLLFDLFCRSAGIQPVEPVDAGQWCLPNGFNQYQLFQKYMKRQTI
jgi:hypothetical protein